MRHLIARYPVLWTFLGSYWFIETSTCVTPSRYCYDMVKFITAWREITETGSHKGFPKIWCLSVMPKKSFYMVWLKPSYDTAHSEIRIEAVISSRRCAAAYANLMVYFIITYRDA